MIPPPVFGPEGRSALDRTIGSPMASKQVGG